MEAAGGLNVWWADRVVVCTEIDYAVNDAAREADGMQELVAGLPEVPGMPRVPAVGTRLLGKWLLGTSLRITRRLSALLRIALLLFDAITVRGRFVDHAFAYCYAARSIRSCRADGAGVTRA